MKKLLFIVDFDAMWPFAGNFSKEFVKNNYEVTIFDHKKFAIYNFSEKESKKIYFKKIRAILEKMPATIRVRSYFLLFKLFIKKVDKFDRTLILYHRSYLNRIAKQIKKKSKKIVIFYAGSDFYRVSSKIKEDNKKLIEISDAVFFNNKFMKDDFINYYKKYEEKCKLIGIISNNFETIAEFLEKEDKSTIREKLGIETEKTIIAIGYNGRPPQNHLKIIDEINKLDEKLKEKLYIILPVTYSLTSEYRKELVVKLDNLGFEYTVFDKKLSENDLARLRILPDITINMQKTDQSSASVFEHTFAQNIMLVADWLPYSFFDEINVYYTKVNWENLTEKIENSLKNLELEKSKCIENSSRIYQKYSWKKGVERLISAIK